MKRFALAFAGAVLFAGSAMAGPQYVDKTGYAISGYDVMSIWDLKDKQSKIGQPQIPAKPGQASITAEYNGAKWAFANEENKKRFLAEPEKYVPAFDGHCAYGVAVGGKVPANPHLWRIVDGKLYMNITKTVVGFWEEDIAGHISKGSTNWNKLEPKDAATRKVPEFDISSAPAKG